MGKLIGEFREPNRKDKVTRFPFVSYARQLGLLVNTLGGHLKFSALIVSDNDFMLATTKNLMLATTTSSWRQRV